MQFTSKEIRHITYPVLISLLMQQLIGLTDTAYLGRVGEVELGASAVASMYYLAIYMLGFGFSVGAQILIARRNGEKQYHRIGAIFMQGTLFLLVIATCVFILSKVYSPQLLHLMIKSKDVYYAAIDYMDWRVYGFFFSFISVMFRAFYIGTTQTKTLTINSVVMVLTNMILNYILIFGKLGFPAMGIAGAAIASSISEAVSVIFFCIYTHQKVNYKLYRLFHFAGFKIKTLLEILNVSFWTMIQSFISTGSWLVFFIAIEHLGERSLAITNIVRNTSALLFIFVNAFASTGSSLVSNLIGNGEIKKVMPLCNNIIRNCYCFVIPLAIIIAIFPTMFLRIYTDNPDLIANALPSLWVMLSAYIVAVPAFVYFFAVSGTGSTRSTLFIELCSLCIYVGYIVYIAVYLKMDVAICWTSDIVYYAMIFTSFFYLWKGNWQNKKI
ncbi:MULTISPECIES: MATE family efflux transporter [unclassified Bacteroides]|uniref:MATE family efflux transporter n=1 Tax=unclassified Bacteroides TaxID=2646097 RepID=UPI00168AA17F|nr:MULTISPECIES: MATE family efflux transporter [unclassified Bacteroides]MBD3589935.1 MATE family efflux transporter [Bacteroides sp. GM023]MCS2335939.1 MATE family efflux transporter [Bacteroides sp. BFG-606]